jgi:hypothetical protein
MFRVPATERAFWRSHACTVRVSYDDTAALMSYGDESAYTGDEGSGERTWLDDHGIERGFSSR